MSENIRGITFAEQAVTPADDAIVRRAILGDGVLTGCEVTYSGSTLTLASGYIIACGRSFQITTAQNFAVVDATSGVARLLLTIDLTQTATEETFNQISFSIEYAAAEDGFVDLIQDDINLSGTKYQIVCAVVSLGTGGITGIVSKLERTEGGGGGLNFKVVPGLTQPGTASENTIWVKTERIGAWYFSATQPEGMQEWDVWFPTGLESIAEFNALKKNGLQVYPLSARQYIDGVLVDKTAMSYLGGEWLPLWNGQLYMNGNEYASVTGGWSALPFVGSTSSGSYTAGTVTKGAESIVLATNGNYRNNTAVITGNKIDLTKYSKMYINVIAFTKSNTDTLPWHSSHLYVADSTNSETDSTAGIASVKIQNTGLHEVNISGINGSYYVKADCYGSSMEFTEVYLVE